MKNTRTADFCADRIDVITNLAVITNAVVKRVHCYLQYVFCCLLATGGLNLNLRVAIIIITVELQWLEHRRDYEEMFETAVVRANEC